MAGETPPPPDPSTETPPAAPSQTAQTAAAESPLVDFINRLKISGKLILIGAFVGLICSFLPLVTVSADTPLGRISNSAKLVDHTLGIMSLLFNIAALAVGVVFYLPNVIKQQQQQLQWIVVGVCGLVGLFGLLLFIPAFQHSGSGTQLAQVNVSPGFGVFLNLIAAGAVVAGGVIKARDEKLF